MDRHIGFGRSVIIALVLLAAAGLAAGSVQLMAARQFRWRETFPLAVRFPAIAGLKAGDPVRVQGMDVGIVEEVVPPAKPGEDVRVRLRIAAHARPLVRRDASVAIESQGVIGTKAVEIRPGKPDAPELSDDDELSAPAPQELAQLMSEATATLGQIRGMAGQAEQGIAQISSIATRINSGEGSLGRLLVSTEIHDQLVGVGRRGEKALVELTENLEALKNTWPFSSYFEGRGFDDRERLLFRPGWNRVGQIMTEAELFEPGRAALTPEGRRRVESLATWARSTMKDQTEVVVLAYTDAAMSEEFATILTQDQADAVRAELVDKHRVGSRGWFRSRKVASVGFGTQLPKAASDLVPNLPSRGVEVLLFTPQQ
jgi:phospholipid/cholesterol/gamma-HCH transport system substrate-binding protein